MKKKLIQIEQEIDKFKNDLDIFKKLSFQSIYSFLLYRSYLLNRDTKKGLDITEDLSRISYIYNLLKEKFTDETFENTNDAFSEIKIKEHNDDINFLYAYSHFCMLMPQIHKGTLIIKSINEKKIELDYPDEETVYAEKIDRLYSTISSPIYFPYGDPNSLNTFFDKLVISLETNIDLVLLNKLYKHHLNFYLNINVLSNKIITKELGFSQEEIDNLFAFLRALSDYSITLSKKHYEYGELNNSEPHIGEHFEWSVCLFEKKPFFDILTKTTNLNQTVVDKILSYFTDIYKPVANGPKFDIGEGFLPPFTIINEKILFSPYSIRSFLSFNKVLYSINKNERKLFDERISNGLEPTLIKQIEYLFSNFKNLECKTNVIYQKSEIDILILSKKENVCLSIQVKATIAPSNSRTTLRVQDRIIEAEKQIEIFNNSNQQNIINNAFNTNLSNTKIIDIIAVRSCAGTKKSWLVNEKHKIVNYTFLKYILGDKKKNKKYNIRNIEKEIEHYQKKIIRKSKVKVAYEEMEINNYKITFPNIEYSDFDLFNLCLKNVKQYPDFENTFE